jgi:Ca2+-dependent lipid-binding protein
MKYIFLFFLNSNHLHGQDILHIDIYDEDFIFDDKIGSVEINLQELYLKGFFRQISSDLSFFFHFD